MDVQETLCKNPFCRREIAQLGGGHRKREYCDDACRQIAHRARVEREARERRQAEVRARWSNYPSEAQAVLEDVMQLAGMELARRVAGVISAEAESQPRAALSTEQARERARLHGYLDEAIYLASTQRLFVRVFQTGRVEPNEMREVIHQERGDAGQAKKRIVALEQELADASQGLDQIQERFREYVQTTNERLSGLTGELAKLRQEQERAAGQEDLRNIEAYQEKLAQASARISKLEGQVECRLTHKPAHPTGCATR